jgi:hypothetical protein
VVLSLGLIGGLILGLCSDVLIRLRFGLYVDLFGGLIILVGVGLGCWSESLLKNAVMSGSIGCLSLGLIFGLGVGLSGGCSSACTSGCAKGYSAA